VTMQTDSIHLGPFRTWPAKCGSGWPTPC